MEGDLNQLDPVEEYENEDSLEISDGATAAVLESTGVQDTASNAAMGEEDPHKHAYQRKPRKRTSAVWKDFSEVEISGVKKHQCNWCKRSFAISKSSCTTTLGRHLNTCFTYIGAKKKQKVLTIDGDGKESDGVGIVSNFSYDHRKVRELCSHMILYHEYPFMHVEHVLFNKFIKTCTPYWEKISRDAARKDCFATYEIEKRKLKNLLKGIHRVNITTDMWTSCQKISYMVVTCHWIDSNWRLNRRVLNFCNVPPHSPKHF